MRQRPSIHAQCKRLYAEDAVFGPVIQHLASRPASAAVPVDVHPTLRSKIPHFFVEDDLLFFQPVADSPRRLCVPNDTDLRNAVHDTAARGHPGSAKTLATAQTKFFWINMGKSIAKYVQSCELCQRVKAAQHKPAGLLHPLEIPHKRWTHISMDFMPDLPPTKSQYDTILVILDRLTKRAHFIPTVKALSSKDTARLFLREYVRLHGVPESIVSDRDPRFLSAFWRTLVTSQGSQIHASTAFKPSTDGRNERSHRFINDYLRAFVAPKQDDWDELLPMAEFAYNSRFHSSIAMTPFAADLGYTPRAFDDITLLQRPQTPADALTFAEHQQHVLQQCRANLESAQASMKRFFDHNRPDLQFMVGDMGLLDTLNLDLAHIGSKGRRKLVARFIGPYRVLERTTPDTYRISLLPGVRLHDEVHVSYLRKYHEDTNPKRLNNVPRLITRDVFEGNQIRSIVGQRKRRGIQQYKVQWYGRDEPDTWEPESGLTQAAGLIAEFMQSTAVTTTVPRSHPATAASASPEPLATHAPPRPSQDRDGAPPIRTKPLRRSTRKRASKEGL
ncbi:hypothetical protein PR001_g2344 [Phytophthora rubi]|uniref:Integrase catalytic domain-containing protein n=1 Tax=Phytophthora rubi TaxID=129364 RepID=A0A6A3P0M1_9STRA|nr:hypothetical protein PR001_g2344 [Phytophthora rubi]